MTKGQLTKNTFLFLLGLVIFLNLTGLFNEILEPDGTLYACLAKHIAKSGNWLNLWGNGSDWLDKPHLPFWFAAISFKIFGISAFSYKLPSFIFFFVSIIYCYKLSAAIYCKEIARFSTLIYATALHTIISNFDGKIEIYLTAFIISAIYHLYKAFEKKWLWHIVAAALFASCAVMTKGIFSLIPITSGFVIFWMKTKQWSEFFKPKWYLFLLLTFIFILPELYSLYSQFDLHPEKIVFGKTNVSGIRFFFWDSQFGRFFNNGPITGDGNLLFFLHTSLWAFIPWSIILLLAIINFFAQRKTTTKYNYRWIIGGSAFTSFLMFSVSKFQLPHYIVILFPFFAMMTADYLIQGVSEKTLKKINVFQTVLFVLLVSIIIWTIVIYSFDHTHLMLTILGVIAVVTIFYKPGFVLPAILKINIGFALFLAVFLNCFFYPSLLKYQAGMMAGEWLNKCQIRQKVTLYKCLSSSFVFYYKGNVNYNKSATEEINGITANDSLFLFSTLNNLKDINTKTVSLSVLKTFSYFHVSQLNSQFINYKTRKDVLDTMVIALIKGKN